MVMSCDDVHGVVDAVCEYMATQEVTPMDVDVDPILTSRHHRCFHVPLRPTDLRIIEFRQAIGPLLEASSPSHPQRTTASWRTVVNEGHQHTLWSIVERFAPGFLTYPTPSPPHPSSVATTPVPKTTCAMCCADMHGTSGTCDVCSTVLYEISMNNMYQNHHTLGGFTDAERPKHSKPDGTNRSSGGDVVRTGSAGAMYQRRAQFRVALASYQGRSTRTVPASVTESVRRHLETTAAHLIDFDTVCPVQRYSRVTRVHVMCVLRSTGGGKYSKWYRESHYFHHVITKQEPPDLSDCENILVLMFDMGIIPFGTKKGKEYHHVHPGARGWMEDLDGGHRMCHDTLCDAVRLPPHSQYIASGCGG